MGSSVFSWEKLTWFNTKWWEVHHLILSFEVSNAFLISQGNYGSQQLYLNIQRIKNQILCTVTSFP